MILDPKICLQVFLELNKVAENWTQNITVRLLTKQACLLLTKVWKICEWLAL